MARPKGKPKKVTSSVTKLDTKSRKSISKTIEKQEGKSGSGRPSKSTITATTTTSVSPSSPRKGKAEVAESKPEVKVGRKRKVENVDDEEELVDEKEEEENPKKAREIKPKLASASGENGGESAVEKSNSFKNVTETDYKSLNFDCDKKTVNGEPWNFKVASWNVAGLRAWLKKSGITYLKKESADVVVLQETKTSTKNQPPEMAFIKDYPRTYWAFSEQPGRNGVGLLSKTKPIHVQIGFPIKDEDSKEDKRLKTAFNKEGRLIVAEYDKIYIVAPYVPNSGISVPVPGKKPYPQKVVNGERLRWDRLLREYIIELEAKKPVIVAGDLNVAHNEIDLANPEKHTTSACFTIEERDNFSQMLKEANLIDTYRFLNPDKEGAYTFWSYRHPARPRNIGWRVDYMLISDQLKDSLVESTIRSDVYGSDHCPLVLMLHL